MKKAKRLSRRTFLRGVGASIALPTLECMLPAPVLAEQSVLGRPPVRMAFCYVPNGVILPKWRIKKKGTLSELSPTLQPLNNFKGDFQVLNNLCNYMANRIKLRQWKGLEVPPQGAHSRSSASFLTGEIAERSAAVRIGKSVDQIAADQIGKFTRLPSMELTCDKSRKAGACENGYSCAYQYNISFRSETTPMHAENSPRLVFERLFGGGGSGEAEYNRMVREQQNKSILDFVMEDAKDLQRNLGRTDQYKLDEYLTSVREIERRIESAGKFKVKRPKYRKPDSGIPTNYKEYIRLMFDMMRLAFQTDTTRVSTFILAHEASYRRHYDTFSLDDTHHTTSHHLNDQKKIKQIEKVDKFYVEQFAYFLNELKQIQEGEGTLLDNCMIVYGSAISDGNLHHNHDLPILLAGGGGGTLKPGRNVRHAADTPMTNLYISMLDRMGVKTKRVGDSTGKLADI